VSRLRSPAFRRASVAALALGLTLALVAPARAATAATAERGDGGRGELLAGERLAEAVTLATGVPISPLLGVSALGAYRWWRTPPALRSYLPWYSQPAFWGTGLFLAFLFAANTTIGAAVPGLKKPMDFVEQFENQASGLIASPIVVLEIVRLLGAVPRFGAIPPWTDAGVAALGGLPPFLAPVAWIGTVTLAMVAYALVFLAFHSIQVLIALSPSALLDFVLRLFRLGMLALAGMAVSVHPYLGAFYGLLVLAVAATIAGWSFRLLVFGSVCGRDLLRPAHAARDSRLVAFAGRDLAGVPLRAYGRLEERGDGRWQFRWRPWHLLPARGVEIGPNGGLAILRGALSPRAVRTGPVREATLARFPPRFRGREAELAARLGGVAVHDGRVVRGLRASWRWLRELAVGTELTPS
jgi:hypothetical protein